MNSNITKFLHILDLTTDFLLAKESGDCSMVERGLPLLEAFHSIKARFLEHDDLNINILDIVSPNENANSRILGRLFQLRQDGLYFILNSFVETFFGDTFYGEINRPEVEFETHRIDLLVKEEGSYAIIFENKIWNAAQQSNQLARYIEAIKNDGFEDEQIYIVYLPQTQDYIPNKCIWMRPSGKLCANCLDHKNCHRSDEENNLKQIYEERFRCIPFNSEILFWLRDCILPTYSETGSLLQSALKQYVNFMELSFGLYQTNSLKMEVEKMICERLGLTGESTSDFDIVSGQIKDINELLKYMKGMLDNFESDAFEKMESSLKEHYPNNTVFSNKIGTWHYVFVTLTCKEKPLNLRAFAAFDISRKAFYYGAMPDGVEKKEERPELIELFKNSIKLPNGFMPGNLWIVYKSSPLSDLEQNLKDFIYMLSPIAE